MADDPRTVSQLEASLTLAAERAQRFQALFELAMVALQQYAPPEVLARIEHQAHSSSQPGWPAPPLPPEAAPLGP
jgi:hypothetical protein